MSFSREVRGFSKKYNSNQTNTRCKIYTIPTEPFLHATSSLIHDASLPTSRLEQLILLKVSITSCSTI